MALVRCDTSDGGWIEGVPGASPSIHPLATRLLARVGFPSAMWLYGQPEPRTPVAS